MAGITLGAKALVDFGKAAIKTSSDLEEIQNVTDTVFRSMSKDIDDFSKTLIESHGIGELSAKKYASYMGAMLKSSGIQGDAVRQMSKDLTLLTADMASFYNLGTEEMFQKLMSGMSGATMPLKQLGINMNIANLEAFAMSQGIKKSWQEMSQAEQVMLRYQYLMAVTGDAQGDFARNSWNWAHSLKILSEKWQEFLGIVGRGLQQVFLPLVKILIKVLDLLIKIATAIEKVFVMITGKKVDVEPRQVGIVDDYVGTMDDLGDFSKEAAKNQKKLGKGIKDAAKAAKGALAPFDELNILQQNLAGGGKGGAGGGQGSPFDGLNFNNDFKMDPVGDSLADGFKKAQEEGEKFFVWFGDKWNRLREMLSIPLMVAEPVFPTLPVPIFEPEWGLDIPHIPNPVFPPIPSPVYRPNWGLDTPKVPAPVFPKIPIPVYNPVWNLVPPPVPAVDYSRYARSLEEMKIYTSETTGRIQENARQAWGEISIGIQTSYEWVRETTGMLWEGIESTTTMALERVQTNVSTALGVIETNWQTHKENVATLATGISTALVTNINSGLSTVGTNVNATIKTVQTNLQTFGKNVATSAAGIAKGFAGNLSEGFKTVTSNFANFANTVGKNLSAFGSGFLRASADTARGFVDNMVSGFQTVWSNFKNLMSALKEKITGAFSPSKGLSTTLKIGAGVAIGAGLVLAAPAVIPYVAGGLAGLASIPALAKGGITDGPMLAMVGDNPGGKEVVSPLDDLMGMIQTAVNETGNSGGDLYLTVKVGEDTLTEKVISNINRQNRISGETVIKV